MLASTEEITARRSWSKSAFDRPYLSPLPSPPGSEQSSVDVRCHLRRLLPRESTRPPLPALHQLFLARRIVRELLQRRDVGGGIAPLHDDDRVAAHFLEPARPRGDDRQPRRERLEHLHTEALVQRRVQH